MNEMYHKMRLRKAPFTEFKSMSISLDDFSPPGIPSIRVIHNVAMMDIELR